MNSTAKKQIQTSLFIGALQNSTVRMHLNHSQLLKQESILRNSDTPSETHYKGKTYLGFPLPSDGVSLNELHAIEEKLRSALTNYCPELPQEEIHITIFPQILIT